MGEKKEIKVSLGTVICIVIIILLLCVIGGMWFYYNYIKNNSDKPKETASNNIIANTTAETNRNDEAEKKSDFSIGTYIIQPDKNILKASYYETADIGDEGIEFKENGKFGAYLGWGMSISGNYELKNDVLSCIANTFSADNMPDQTINATIEFKIIDETCIEIIETSGSFKMRSGNLENNTLTDQINDMSLHPFVKGIKFKKGNGTKSLIESINGKTFKYINSNKDKYTIELIDNQFIIKCFDMTVEGTYEAIDSNNIKCNIKSYTWNDGAHKGGMNLEKEEWYIEFEIRGNNLIVPKKCFTGNEGDSEIQNVLHLAFGEKFEYRGE